MSLKAFAAAKINLFLHVGPLRPDGYHPIASWMVFADVGDEVELVLHQPEPAGIEVDGPFALGTPTDQTNLALRARNLWLGETWPETHVGLRLTKNLPPASGIGGGSSDAAATLRAMNQYGRMARGDLEALGATLGSDVPSCVRAQSLIATGRGEVLADAPHIPWLDAVLVNPGIATATGPIFAAYDGIGGQEADLPSLPTAFTSVEALAAWLGDQRNDLEEPARELEPKIGEVLDALTAAHEALMARMSGSGATCFALCATAQDAQALQDRLAAAHPAWWIRACRLGGPWPDDFTNA